MNVLLNNKTTLPSLLEPFFRDKDDYFSGRLMNHLFEIDRNVTKKRIPSVNLSETDSQFNIELSVPGFSKKDLKVSVNNNLLTVECEKKTDESTQDYKFIRQEFNYTSFKRSFTLPDNVDSANIEPKMENGILLISIPKTKIEESLRLIEVK